MSVASRVSPALLLLFASAISAGCTDPQQGSASPSADVSAADVAEDTTAPQDVTTVADAAASDSAVVHDVSDGSDAPSAADAPDAHAVIADVSTQSDTSISGDAWQLPDAKVNPDIASSPDTTAPDATSGGDAGAQGPPLCGAVEFTLKPGAGAKKVTVTGDWVGWNIDKGAALSDPDGDGTWSANVLIGPGKWLYKFVVDGKWLPDPNNPESVDDGFGGKNSVLVIPDCPKPLGLISAKVDHKAGTLQAELKATMPGFDATKALVTVDWTKHTPGCKPSGANGCKIDVATSGAGIHDVRVQYGDEMLLFKVYNGLDPDWRGGSIYFAMTDRFDNGDKTNDKPQGGIPAILDWHGGDFAGIKKRIESGYLEKLGVDALWISWPATQFSGAEPGGRIDQTGCGLDPKKANYKPTKYTAYHGYWPTETQQVEPRFGSMQDLRDLVSAAHKTGLRVLLDFTANHVHTDSPLYKKYGNAGWFHQPADVCADVGWGKKPVECWFTKYLADFNYDNPLARKTMVDAAVWWAKQSGADGYRLDAVKHIEMVFVEDLRKKLGEELELTGVDFYLVGETFTGDAKAIAWFLSDSRLHAQFDFPTNNQLLNVFGKKHGKVSDMDNAIRGIKGVYGKHSMWMSPFAGNHDISRFISLAGGDVACGPWDIVSNQASGWKNPPKPPTQLGPYRRLWQALVYNYAIPGMPLLYYGDEFGLPGGGDPDNRRPMRFGSALSKNEAWMLKRTQQLGTAHNRPEFRHNAWPKPFVSGFDIVGFSRVTADGKSGTVVVVNRSAKIATGQVKLAGQGFKLDASNTISSCVQWPDDAGKGIDCKTSISAGTLSWSAPGAEAVLVTIDIK